MTITWKAVLVRLDGTTVVCGTFWLLAPLGLWPLLTQWVRLTTPFLSLAQVWLVAGTILLLTLLSIFGHTLAHIATARRVGSALPTHLPLYPFGEASQVWPGSPDAGRELLVALAGPGANVLLAIIGYSVWSLQLLPLLDAASLFLVFFNLALAVVNLAPCTPFDGARVVRALFWGMLRRPQWGEAVNYWFGYALVLGLLGWSIHLLRQQARFSVETGLGTLAAALLILLAAKLHRRAVANQLLRSLPPLPRRIAGLTTATAIILVQLAAALSLLPRVEGVYAPGLALAVKPMIAVDAEYRYDSDSTFLLTTVITQTPIITAQWVQALFNPSITLVPPEQIVPPNTSVAEQVRYNAHLLEESEAVAIVTALRLAGYEASVTSQAAEVLSIQPESAAHGMLQPGDEIVGVGESHVSSASELIGHIAALRGQEAVELTIKRDGNGENLRVRVPLLAPEEPDGSPRIGIIVQSVGFAVDLPFEVTITPRQISGGPSAGLMFTLTVYDLVTPGDLTAGRRIAGTGTINLHGEVGPIGGVAQKVAAAERAGAEYFLVPTTNYRDAQHAATTIRVIDVGTVAEAIAVLRSLDG